MDNIGGFKYSVFGAFLKYRHVQEDLLDFKILPADGTCKGAFSVSLLSCNIQKGRCNCRITARRSFGLSLPTFPSH